MAPNKVKAIAVAKIPTILVAPHQHPLSGAKWALASARWVPRDPTTQVETFMVNKS